MRPIDADEAAKKIASLARLARSDKQKALLGRCIYIVEHCKTVDAEPVRHGRWVYDPNGMDFNLGAWVCSECRERNNNLGCMRRINPYQFVGSRFCPNCGAKMKGCEQE